MSMNDPIADMITRIRNAQRAYLPKVAMPSSKTRVRICEALQREGFIRHFEVKDQANNKKALTIELKYFEGEPAIKEITRVSKCGRRIYSSIDKMPRVHNGLGTQIVSTSKGVMSDYEARQQHVGGEILFSVF